MIWNVLLLMFLSFLPLIELRLAIPLGILSGTMNLPFGISLSGMGLNPLFVFAIASVSDILLGFLLFNLLYLFDNSLKNSRVGRKYILALERAQRKIKPSIDKYGILGLALFIGFPIPGSGVYMGSLGAFVIGMKKKDFYKGMILGVLFASTIVTLLTVLGISLF